MYLETEFDEPIKNVFKMARVEVAQEEPKPDPPDKEKKEQKSKDPDSVSMK